MRRGLYWFLTAVVMVGIGLAVLSTSSTPPLEASPRCAPGAECPSGSPRQTGTVAGTATTCSDARNNAEYAAMSQAFNQCVRPVLTCNFYFVEEDACFTNGQGQKQVNGHGRFNCAPCEDITACI